MALTLQQFKEQNPEYGDIEDGVLADYLHKKYYSHIEPSSFYKQISYDDPNADGDFTRGVKDSFKQLPELGYGLVAGAGATGETLFGNNGLSSDVKNFAVDKIKQEETELAKTSKDSDSLTYSLNAAKQGDLGSLVDWAQRSSGYALGQGAQLVATGGVGGILGKAGAQVAVKQTVKNMAIKEAERLAATDAAKGLTADEIAKLATANVASKLSSIGANTAIGASAYGMEGGEIGGDLAKQSVDENRVLTPDEITRGLGATAAAGALEFAGDKLGLNILTGKSKLFNSFDSKPGIMGKVARGSMAGIAAAPVEGGTEYGQTLIENYGKGQDPFSEKSKQDAFDAAGQGFLGGAVMAGAGGMLTQAKTPEQRDVDINHDILNAPSIDDAIDVMGKAVNEPVDNVVNRIIGSESGGRDNAKNPLSSAAGAGQFIDSTWLDMLHKHRPDLVEGRTKEQLLALKMNGDLSREMTAHYAQDNADALQRNGFEPSPENIYLAHHFGIGGASNLLSANPNAPVSSVMDAMVIRANPYMQGKTVGQVRDWVANRMKPIEGELLPPEHPVNRYKGPQGYIEGGAIDSELNRLGLPAPDEAQQRSGILANAGAIRRTPELGTTTTEPSASVEEASTPVAANAEPFAPTHRLDDGTEVAYGEDSFGPHFVDANGDQFEYTDSALPLGQTKQQAPISQEEAKQPEVEQDNQFVTVTDKVTGKSFNVIKSDYEAGKEKLAAYNSDTNKALNIKLPIKNVTPITQAAEPITNESKVQPVSLDTGAAPGGNAEAVGNGEKQSPVLGEGEESETVKVKDIYGSNHLVNKKELDSNRTLLRRYNKDGKKIEGMIHRENIDLEGNKAAEAWKDLPYISGKNDRPFKTLESLKQKIASMGQKYEDFQIENVEDGFVAIRKKLIENEGNTQPTETKAPDQNSEPVKQQSSKSDGLDSSREDVTKEAPSNKPTYKITDRQSYYFEQGVKEGAASHALGSNLNPRSTATQMGFHKDAEVNPFIKGFYLGATGAYEQEWRGSKNLVKEAESRGDLEVKRKEISHERVGEYVPKIPAVHIEGRSRTTATQEEITTALRKASERKNWSKTQMKDWLVAEIDKAILDANDVNSDVIKNRLNGEAEASATRYFASLTDRGAPSAKELRERTSEELQWLKSDYLKNEYGQITFDVPGDGKFKVLNTKYSLEAFKEKVLESPGFKETREGGGNRTTSLKQTDSLKVAQQYVGEANRAKTDSNRDEALQTVVDIAINESLNDEQIKLLLDKASPVVKTRFAKLYSEAQEPVQETPKNEQVAEDVSKKEEEAPKDYFKDKSFLKFLAKQKIDIAPEEGAPTQKVSATVAIDSLDKQIEALRAFIDCVKG